MQRQWAAWLWLGWSVAIAGCGEASSSTGDAAVSGDVADVSVVEAAVADTPAVPETTVEVAPVPEVAEVAPIEAAPADTHSPWHHEPGERGMCDPCSATDQCDDAEAACVAFGKPAGSNGFFCATACGSDGACPAGAYCDQRSTVAGDTAQVCVPKSETCACSTKAKAAGWTTSCFGVIFGADGLISKQCAGSWTCATGGCSATYGANETCNGKDDDCDGKIDEDNVCKAEGKCASAADCDDKNACTDDACAAGACSHTAIAGCCLDKFDCPAAKNCAPPIACVANKCVEVPEKQLVCDPKVGSACAVHACDPNTGKCALQPVPDGKACGAPGDPCTAGDTCQKGKCLAGPNVCDDGNPCTADLCDNNGCGHLPQIAACSDGNACTSGDACSQGACKGGAVKPCNDGNPCTVDGCNANSGACTVLATAGEGSDCDDGNACTASSACQSGTCKAGGALPCGDGNPCTDDGCDTKLGCTHKANAAACDDGNPCTQGDTCAQGMCGPGKNTCACQTQADCAATAKANPCLGAFQCDTQAQPPKCVPVPGAAVKCGGAGPCQIAACDPATGLCTVSVASDGSACSDGNECTVTDACKAGSCQGKAVNCEDGDPCTDNLCHKALGCIWNASKQPCSDGNACTTGDTCANGLCQPGSAKDCGDGQPCTVDGCDAKTGTCTHDGKALEGKACGSGVGACGPAVCQSGACAGLTGSPCNDGNPCTDDACIAAKGCGHTATGAVCDDGNACTAGDLCAASVCKGGKAVNCDDGNACTADICDAAAGCKHQANSTLPCDDGDACTEIDTCDAGVCKGKPKACDDGKPCTLDGCSKGACTVSASAMDGKTCPPPGACNADGICGSGTCTAPKANCPVQKGKQIWPVVFPAKLGPAKAIYDPVGVHLVQFTIGDAEWAKFKALVAAKKLTDTYFPAKITFDGEDFGEIGVRPFGYGSMFYNPNKPSIRAKFNAFIEGKKGPDGLRNIRFKNSGQDRTFLRQPLSQLMVQLAGGYAPRFGWARLWVNGEPMGIYQVFEQVDKKFFHANFDNDEGNDYQRKKTCLGFNCSSPTCQEVADNQTGDTGDGSEMAAIAKVVKWSADATWVQEVDKLIDWAALLAQYAVEATVSDIDSLAAAGQNFTTYIREDNGMAVTIPTGMDLVMGAGNAPYSVWSPWGPPCNWCASRKDEFYLRILANPGQKAKFVERLKFLRCGPMAPATMNAVIDGYWKLLHDDIYGDPKGQATAAELDKRYTQLKQWITDRAAYLDGIVGPCP